MRHSVGLPTAIFALAVALVVAPAVRAQQKDPPAPASGGQVSQAAAASPYSMIYTPIAPCRVFGGQPIATNQTGVYRVSGNSNLTAQGGPVGGCGIPAYAQAVSINMSSGTSTAQGYLTAYAAGAARPNQASLSYRTYPATSGSIVQLGSGGRISVFASAATRVSGDVTGYYERQLWAFVDLYGTVLNSSGRVTGTSVEGTGQYTVSFDRNLDTCSATVTPNFGVKFPNVHLYGNNVQITLFSPSASYIDGDYFVQVSC